MEPSRPPPPRRVTGHCPPLPVLCLAHCPLEHSLFLQPQACACAVPLLKHWAQTGPSHSAPGPAGDSWGVGPGEYRLGDQAAAPWGSSRLAPSSAPTVEWVWTRRARCPLILSDLGQGLSLPLSPPLQNETNPAVLRDFCEFQPSGDKTWLPGPLRFRHHYQESSRTHTQGWSPLTPVRTIGWL